MAKQNYETLVCFTDGNELHIAIGALIIKPEKELLLLSETMDNDTVKSVQELLDGKGLNLKVSISDYHGLNRKADRFNRLAVLVNQCTTIDDYRMLVALSEKGADLFFADVTEGQVLSLKGSGDRILPGGPIELEVDEVLEVSGYNIQTSEEEIIKSPAIEDMLEFVTQNSALWDEVRRVIKNNYAPHGDWIQFGTRFRINYSDGSAMKRFAEFLESKDYLTERIITSHHVHFKIPDAIIRTFIQTTGLWLEALTYRTVHAQPFIDDAKADVRFIWGSPPCSISNEIDVVATSDSRMIFISCKDMESLSTGILNELEVYSRRIAGNKAIKILVTAKRPGGHHIFDRAEAMGINIVWYSNDAKRFSDILKMILERELA